MALRLWLAIQYGISFRKRNKVVILKSFFYAGVPLDSYISPGGGKISPSIFFPASFQSRLNSDDRNWRKVFCGKIDIRRGKLFFLKKLFSFYLALWREKSLNRFSFSRSRKSGDFAHKFFLKALKGEKRERKIGSLFCHFSGLILKTQIWSVPQNFFPLLLSKPLTSACFCVLPRHFSFLLLFLRFCDQFLLFHMIWTHFLIRRLSQN